MIKIRIPSCNSKREISKKELERKISKALEEKYDEIFDLLDKMAASQMKDLEDEINEERNNRLKQSNSEDEDYI